MRKNKMASGYSPLMPIYCLSMGVNDDILFLFYASG
jgi:hypothetical protein